MHPLFNAQKPACPAGYPSANRAALQCLGRHKQFARRLPVTRRSVRAGGPLAQIDVLHQTAIDLVEAGRFVGIVGPALKDRPDLLAKMGLKPRGGKR